MEFDRLLMFPVCLHYTMHYMNYCTITWHAGNAVLLNQIQKQCNKIIRNTFYRYKNSKANDVYRNYGMLQVNYLFKFHAVCFVTI